MGLFKKHELKELLGDLPLTAEVYWYLRQHGQPLKSSFKLEQLEEHLPGWRKQVETHLRTRPPSEEGKRVLIFSVLHYWIEHASVLGLALAGLGHSVELAFMPFGRWQDPINRFDLRRQNIYARNILNQLAPYVQATSLLDVRAEADELPGAMRRKIEQITLRDTQYTLQVEEVDPQSDLYRLRHSRNSAAARSAWHLLTDRYPDVVIVPNGSIFEFGVLYQMAHYLGLPVVTYEFGEQRERIWLALDGEVMRQNTEAMWAARGGVDLLPDERDQVQTLYASRQRASLWENFARRWQGVPSAGGEKARANLGLDQRPIVLLATNVIGDSLTLGRQVFSDSMTEWLKRTVAYFSQHPEIQLVMRIHPGELITQGPSVAEVIEAAFGELPEQIHLVPADAQVNTYDLVEIADLGLVYTTTVGLEMAMSGIPVLAIGQTHYRGKGFTLDPVSWEDYFDTLDRVCRAPEEYRLSPEQVARAWEYAYRFFFEFPHPFPWHIVHLWDDVKDWPLIRVLSGEGRARFGNTFRYLTGEPIDWAGYLPGLELHERSIDER